MVLLLFLLAPATVYQQFIVVEVRYLFDVGFDLLRDRIQRMVVLPVLIR